MHLHWTMHASCTTWQVLVSHLACLPLPMPLFPSWYCIAESVGGPPQHNGLSHELLSIES